MKSIQIGEKKLSNMTHGTVQLGMNYGIANTTGQPAEEESFAMLGAALKGGVSSIDTARVYGNSEDVIGHFFRQYDGELPFITTKVPKIEGETEGEIEKFVVSSVETSLEKLGVPRVNCVMLHVTADITAHGDKTAKALESLVKRGYTDLVGASVYLTNEVDDMLKSDVYTAIQVPMSIFDQRPIHSGAIDRLGARGVTVFVRSVFLQGIFFLDPDKITDPILVEQAAPRIRLLREYAEREGISVASLAIAFIRDLPGVSSLVLGSDTKAQVEQNIGYFDVPPISERTAADIKRDFADVDIPEIMKVLSRPKK